VRRSIGRHEPGRGDESYLGRRGAVGPGWGMRVDRSGRARRALAIGPFAAGLRFEGAPHGSAARRSRGVGATVWASSRRSGLPPTCRRAGVPGDGLESPESRGAGSIASGVTRARQDGRCRGAYPRSDGRRGDRGVLGQSRSICMQRANLRQFWGAGHKPECAPAEKGGEVEGRRAPNPRTPSGAHHAPGSSPP